MKEGTRRVEVTWQTQPRVCVNQASRRPHHRSRVRAAATPQDRSPCPTTRQLMLKLVLERAA